MLVCFGVGEVLHAGIQATFYVSPTGNDARDGKSAATAFATLAKARDAVRPLRGNMSGDVVVEILKGDYPLAETISFTEQDSGTNGFNVIYKNHDGIGTARFIGGTKVAGWTPYKGNIRQAKIGAGLAFTTLYENAIRADLARWPKRTSPFATSRGGYMTFVAQRGVDLILVDSAISPDGTPFDTTGKDFSNAWVYGWNGSDGHRWCSVTSAITSASNSSIGIKNCGLGYPPDSFLIEGSLDLLTQPGEFYYDKAKGVLYYCSRFPGPIERQEIIAPALLRLIDVSGASNPAHNIEFSGLTFMGTDRIAQSNTNDWVDRQQSSWDAAVYIKNAQNVTVRNCRIADSGINGITLDGSQTCAITGCLIERTGYQGVDLKGGSHNTVSNCLIRYCGELRGHGRGVNVVSDSNILKNLEIYYIARAGVCTGRNTTVSYVKVHDCVQDSGDQGGFYLCATTGSTFNQCTSFHNYTDLSNMDRPPTAVYDDRDATDTVWSNIDAGDSQFHNFRHDPMQQGTLTFINVSWDPKCNPRSNEIAGPVNPAFDKSKMEYDRIGITPDFPSAYNDLKAKPEAPLNIWGQPGFNAAMLHWTQADRTASYTIMRATSSGGPYRKVGTSQVPPTGWDMGTTFTDTGLTNGTTYYYVVTAANRAGESPASIEFAAMPSDVGARKLNGKTIGTGGNLAAAVDGDLKTWFDSPNGWVGLDLGNPAVITEIHYAPRSDNTDTTAKMCNGEFQGSNNPDFSDAVTLFQVRATKGGAVTPVLIPVAVFNVAPFRYVRYIGPKGKQTLLAEMEFYGHPAR